MASSITFSSIKEKCSELANVVRRGLNNNFDSIKRITTLAAVIFGSTTLIGLPFAFLLKHSSIVIGESLFILAGLIMLNPLCAKIIISGFIISSIAWVSLMIYENSTLYNSPLF